MDFFSDRFQEYSLLFARLVAMFSVAPFFSGQSFSYFYRIALAFFTALLVVPVVVFPQGYAAIIHEHYFLLLLEQAVIGGFIGLALQFLFAGFQMAGEFYSVQMGINISEVFDPEAQISLPLMGTLKNMLGLFVFFVSGAHIWLLKAVCYSFERIPWYSLQFLGEKNIYKTLTDFLLNTSGGMFVVALKMAVPVMGTLLLVSVTLGLISKAAPQMNILMLGFPVKTMVAFMVLAWLAPVFIEMMLENFDAFFRHMDNVIRSWPQ